MHDGGRRRKPAALNFWVAEHRRLVRVLLACADLAIVALLVLDVLHSGARWNTYLQPVVWGLITLQFGWLILSEVDRWRAEQDLAL